MLALIQPIGIIFSNAIPLAGALWLDWSVFEIIWLYWFENVAIGMAHFVRLWVCARTNGIKEERSTAFFFAMHYGIFTFVHGVFVLVFFGVLMQGLTNFAGGLLAPIAALMTWQFIWLCVDGVMTQGFKGQTPDALMFQPYPRVMALHITIIAAGWFIAEAGSPLWALVLLVSLKTLFELGVYGFTLQGNRAPPISALRKPMGEKPH